MPTISIIVPVYKVEPYLRRCIDSILNQTFRDFECILVDDGSPDACGSICDEYAAKDARIRVIHQENRGISAARNTGLRHATGTYVMFCDSDDYVADTWCEAMVTSIRQHPDMLTACDLRKVSEAAARPLPSNLIPSIYRSVTYFELYKAGLSPYVWNKIFIREILTEHQLLFDESCKFAEDVPFVVAYASHMRSCLIVDAQLYAYVQRNGSIMNRTVENLFSLHLPLFSCRLPLIADEHMAEYCDIWLFYFIQLLDNVFSASSELSFIQKLAYNHRMINSPGFRFCLAHASGKNESKLFLFLLKTRCYILYYAAQKLVWLKQRLIHLHH